MTMDPSEKQNTELKLFAPRLAICKISNDIKKETEWREYSFLMSTFYNQTNHIVIWRHYKVLGFSLTKWTQNIRKMVHYL